MKDSCNLPESDLPIRRRKPLRTCAGQSARDASAKTYVVEVAAILRNLLLLFREQSRFCVRRSIGITGNQGYGKNGPVHASLAHRLRSLRIFTADVSAIIEKQEFYVSVVFNPSMIIRTPKKTNYPSQVRGRGTRTAAITTVTSRDTRIGADRPMIQEMRHMKTSAETDPTKTSHRLCDIARMAPMKKVLSPISMLRIIRNVFMNPETHPLFLLALAYVGVTDVKYVLLV